MTNPNIIDTNAILLGCPVHIVGPVYHTEFGALVNGENTLDITTEGQPLDLALPHGEESRYQSIVSASVLLCERLAGRRLLDYQSAELDLALAA